MQLFQLKGVMHPKSSEQSSWGTVEDFIRAYEHESEKLGQPLIRCPDGCNTQADIQQWTRSCSAGIQQESFQGHEDAAEVVEQAVEQVSYQRSLSEEVEQVLKLAESCRARMDLKRDKVTMTLHPNEDPWAARVLAWSLCTLSTFSLGLALGLRGW
eukprot:TRINITY_DN42132_c0_g1_i1.p1 TRINITY_DN42132_c0_g1~~TRINITY_DN42132_c0_g1_i1.p1  ORF type:complete len:156 (+),score=30.79 TRINITY_DN42132_c0_g1_i1:98-565(+)